MRETAKKKKKWIEPNFMTTYFVHIYKLVLSAYSITQYYENKAIGSNVFFVKEISVFKEITYQSVCQ